jgi:hypothetical protein
VSRRDLVLEPLEPHDHAMTSPKRLRRHRAAGIEGIICVGNRERRKVPDSPKLGASKFAGGSAFNVGYRTARTSTLFRVLQGVLSGAAFSSTRPPLARREH